MLRLSRPRIAGRLGRGSYRGCTDDALCAALAPVLSDSTITYGSSSAALNFWPSKVNGAVRTSLTVPWVAPWDVFHSTLSPFEGDSALAIPRVWGRGGYRRHMLDSVYLGILIAAFLAIGVMSLFILFKLFAGQE